MRHHNTCISRHAQLEVSFQWIYVLVAGGAFLIIFFVLMKGCTQVGETKISAGSMKSAGNALAGLAWQPTKMNLTMPEAEVTCPASTLAISAIQTNKDVAVQTISLDRVPAFLPPRLGGRLSIITKELTLGRAGTPPIALGNILYGIDQNTQYYLLSDGNAAIADRIGKLLQHPNVHVLSSTEFTAASSSMPKNTRTVVIATFNNVPLPAPTAFSRPTTARVLGVQVKLVAKAVEFSELQGTAYGPAVVKGFDGDYLLAGAIVSARPSTYTCAKTALVERTRKLTGIYAMRTSQLAGDIGVPQRCRATLKDANTTFATLNKKNDNDAYLGSLFGTASTDLGPYLIDAHDGLYSMTCPVIA